MPAACESSGMANTTSNDELARKIEQLVQEHIAEIQRTAQQAVERAFAMGSTPATSQPRRQRGREERQERKCRAGGRRRTPEELAAIGDRLYAAVCAHPGEGIATLSQQIGASVDELSRPMTRLKRAGRIRSIGQRHLTRYFPMTATHAAE